MADSDTQCLIEDGELRLVEEEQVPALRRLFGGRLALRGAAALAILGCAAAAAVHVARRGAAAGPGRLQDHALREGMTELILEPPAQCSAYTDCATLPGDCCPTAEGNIMGCCNSPRLDTLNGALSAGPLELGAAPELIPGQCQDTWGWTNGYVQCNGKGFTAANGCLPTGLTCTAYNLFGWCANGAALPGKEWTQGAGLNSPEENCCVCGKAPNPPADELPEAPGTVAPLAPVPSPPAAGPTSVTQEPPAVTTLGLPNLPTIAPVAGQAASNATQGAVGDCAASSGCAALNMTGFCCPTADGVMLGCCGGQVTPKLVPGGLAPASVTSAPLGGGAAPNGTQGEPAGGDCAASPGCADLGITGLCCPTAGGTMLGCCSDLGAGPPALLPPAPSPGPLMTFYMYRVANDQDYPINGVNMANLAGDMWYLHNEVVQHCPRKFNMERLLRFKVTARATPELYGQNKNFDSFVAFDQAKCTVPMCQKLHWTPFGYVVGCQPNNVGQVAVPGSPTWYSLPGTCPNQFYYEKTEACNMAEPGGACPTPEVTGTRNCTYYLERAGEIRLDDLTGLQDYNKVCQSTGVQEYNEETDMGVGTKFWNGKTDAAAGSNRMQQVKDLFAQKFPSMPTDLNDPVCDVQG